MEYISVYVTTANRKEASDIAHALVREKLAACVNIFEGVSSVYRWQGEIEQASEAVMIAKTKKSLFERISARIRELHSYDCPCIVALPVLAGDRDYLRWLNDNIVV